MLHKRLALAVVTALALSPAGLRADGLIHRLPEDGRWAQYDLQFAMSRDGQEREITGTLRVASVGRTTENGKDARWIEFRLDLTGPDDREQTILAKVLVPEEHLQAGRSPIDRVVRGWLKEGEREPQPIDENNRGPLHVFLAGRGKDHKPLETETINNAKLGEIETAGARGRLEWKERDRQLSSDYEVRTHEKAPFGVVSLKFTIRSERNGHVRDDGTVTLTLSDVGDAALSDLPSQK